jgi:hypothetical protein
MSEIDTDITLMNDGSPQELEETIDHALECFIS